MILALLAKSLKELRSDPLLVLLTILCAPFFVLLYKLIFLEGMTVYDVLLYSEPTAIERPSIVADELADALDRVQYPGGGRLFRFRQVDSYNEGITILENRDARILAIFGAGSDHLPTVTLVGDHSDPYYLLASRLFRTAIEDYLTEHGALGESLRIEEEPLGISREKTEFENYVPGLVVFSTLVLIYLFVLLLARESESRVFDRYRLHRLPAAAYVGAYTMLFLVLATAASLLALGTAFALGFRSPVSVIHDLAASVAICATLSLAAAGAGFVVAGIAKGALQAFQLATFPFMILVFFSGSVYPFPKIVVFQLAGRPVGLFDFLPATHAVAALHKVLTFGSPLRELGYEITALLFTSVVFFLGGAAVFGARKLRRSVTLSPPE